MTDHVRFASSVVVARTRDGEFMTDALQLSEPAVVAWREAHSHQILALAHEVDELRRLVKAMVKQDGVDTAADVHVLESEISKALQTLDRLCGSTLR